MRCLVTSPSPERKSLAKATIRSREVLNGDDLTKRQGPLGIVSGAVHILALSRNNTIMRNLRRVSLLTWRAYSLPNVPERVLLNFSAVSGSLSKRFCINLLRTDLPAS